MAVLVGEGTSLKIGSNTLVKCVTIGGFETSAAQVKRTHLGSTSHEYRFGIPDNGTVTAQYQYDPANTAQQAIFTLSQSFQAATAQACEMIYADGSKHTFNAGLTGYKVSGQQQESDVVVDITLKISGAVTYVAAP